MVFSSEYSEIFMNTYLLLLSPIHSVFPNNFGENRKFLQFSGICEVAKLALLGVCETMN